MKWIDGLFLLTRVGLILFATGYGYAALKHYWSKRYRQAFYNMSIVLMILIILT
ncbi:conserved domain protein [Paenibacillus sp. HGF5]|nr:conserved domain protein [Paenibacillus sp. HGF5]